MDLLWLYVLGVVSHAVDTKCWGDKEEMGVAGRIIGSCGWPLFATVQLTVLLVLGWHYLWRRCKHAWERAE